VLKRRIIPIELMLDGRLVKTCLFDSLRDVGDPVKSSKVYSDQDADELLLLQINRDARPIAPLVDVVKQIAEHCFVPFTVGGGITKVEEAAQLFDAGADKVLVNSVAYREAQVLADIAERYGSQAVLVGIDVRLEKGNYVLYSDCGQRREFATLG